MNNNLILTFKLKFITFYLSLLQTQLPNKKPYAHPRFHIGMKSQGFTRMQSRPPEIKQHA